MCVYLYYYYLYKAYVACNFEISFILYNIVGRYNKYSRVLSQTPWFVDGDRKSESSVQELLCTKILEIVKPQSKYILRFLFPIECNDEVTS